MRYSLIERVDLAEMLGQLEIFNPESRMLLQGGLPDKIPPNGKMWACWTDEKEERSILPRLIILGKDDYDEFFAWSATYLNSLRPFTAFVRVLTWRDYEAARTNLQRPELPPLALVGAIIGEALLDVGDWRKLSKLPLSAFETTYFWSFSQAILNGFSETLFSTIDENWFAIREMTNQASRKSSREMFTHVASVFNVSSRRSSQALFAWSVSSRENVSRLAEVCEVITREPRMPIAVWDWLTHALLDPEVLDVFYHAPKEQRVEKFEECARILGLNRNLGEHGSFLLGYLASLVSGGSLEHAQLLIPLQAQFPSATIWYGICSGLIPNSQLRAAHDYLGLRLERELKRRETILDVPTCDISAGELAVLWREYKSRGFRQAHASLLRIELAPTVCSVVKFQSKDPQEPPQAVAQTSSAAIDTAVDELVRRLRGALAFAESLKSPETRHGEPKMRKITTPKQRALKGVAR